MVKVGKMFVCIETVGRVARRAIAAAGSVASRVRAMVLRIFYSAVNEIDRDPRRFSEGEHDGHARGPVVVAVVLLCAGRSSWRYRSLGLRTGGGPARPCSWLALISCWMRVRVLLASETSLLSHGLGLVASARYGRAAPRGCLVQLPIARHLLIS